jgi:predicted nucleotidyltransferase
MPAPDDLMAQLRRFPFAERTGIVAAYVFGSVAAGTAGDGSDVDVAVLYAHMPPSRLDADPIRLEGDLERALGRTVQVVSLNSAPPDLAIRVLRGGELIFEADRSARIQFEVLTRKVFFDLEPILRRYRRLEAVR